MPRNQRASAALLQMLQPRCAPIFVETFNQSINARICERCTGEMYVPTSKSVCTKCAANEVVDRMKFTECVVCSAGTQPTQPSSTSNQESRYSTCEACPLGLYSADGSACKKCGFGDMPTAAPSDKNTEGDARQQGSSKNSGSGSGKNSGSGSGKNSGSGKSLNSTGKQGRRLQPKQTPTSVGSSACEACETDYASEGHNCSLCRDLLVPDEEARKCMSCGSKQRSTGVACVDCETQKVTSTNGMYVDSLLPR